MRMSATREIGGLESSIVAVGAELEAVAAACGSTGWCLWNHLCTLHFFCGLLGPAHADLLTDVVTRHRWVCLPAGAGTAIVGRCDGDDVALNGVASFGSGARYADMIGVTFVMDGERTPQFALISSATPGVRIEPTWRGMSLRASATDHVHYESARVPLARVVSFVPRYREQFRDGARPMDNARYR